MKFTQDWFSPNLKNWRVWLKNLMESEDKLFLEIGCFEGMATLWLMENSKASIVCVDTFEGSIEHKNRGLDFSQTYKLFLENTARYRDRIMIEKKRSEDALLKLIKHNYLFDFIYIDGSHQARDVLSDAVLSWKVLKRGGIMIFDDYGWTSSVSSEPHFSPKIAIDAFLECYRDEIAIMGKGHQVCVKKYVSG